MKLFDWLRRPPPPPEILLPQWQAVLDLPLFVGLNRDEAWRLCVLGERFLSRKQWVGTEGLVVTDAMRRLLALTASLPILNLNEDSFDDWRGVILYPAPFVVRDARPEMLSVTQWGGVGVVHEEDQIQLGQARGDGPILLSWPDAERASRQLDGFNVILHEIAHKLDMLNGVADGFPPLHRGMQRMRWTEVWQSNYRLMRWQARMGQLPHWLDAYACSSPAECFAVLSETFFELPFAVAADYPALYQQLVLFYRQDPRARMMGPRRAESTT
ncbi:zinc-dependent peptidase [Leeia sp.]|uniref:M90 family metallopeptidase n=1 Tax=Leeia sp. TaxID=2884678 RepID=UPI0035B346AD